ncbi:MAG: thiolase family protein [Azospirillaceae bacterium]|nr:thiolase family protein [Azospirillaceae bacterium]
MDVVISGIGQSAVGRRLERSGLGLTVDATLEALADAGLEVPDIDGIATYPGFRPDMPAFSPVSSLDLKEALGFRLDWYSGGLEGPAQLGALINAYAAIKAGLARHVVCFRTVKEGTGGAAWKQSSLPSTERTRVSGEFQWILPFNAISATNWLSLYAQRHFHLYGTTREQMAQISLNARRNGALNPKALYREAITLDDYLSSRMISTPLCLFDCDTPSDASTVIILSSADAARDLKSTPVHIDSVGSAIHGKASWDQADMPSMAAFDAGRMLWSRTDWKPADVDVALLYDGFTFLTLTWLEAMGFCGVGESGAFVDGGARIARDGVLPLNPHGGQLAAGRTHGFGFVHEAVTQLRGLGGDRQVAGDVKLAAVGAGGGPIGGALLLARR